MKPRKRQQHQNKKENENGSAKNGTKPKSPNKSKSQTPTTNNRSSPWKWFLLLTITMTTTVTLCYIYDTGGFQSIIDVNILQPLHIKETLQSTGKDSKSAEDVKNSEEKPEVPKIKKLYSKLTITNKLDNSIRGILDEADSLLSQNNLEVALSKYEAIILKYPNSPRAHAGRAQTLDKLAEQKRSNAILEQCIEEYQKVLDLNDVPKELLLTSGQQLATRQTFRGWSGKATKTLRFLVQKFPDDTSLQNNLGISFLMQGKTDEAKTVFQELHNKHPGDGVAMAHLGFILKTKDQDYKTAIPLLQKGIASGDKGTSDGRFYFHLGDALQRENKTAEARKVYKQGADKRLFRSMWQRSLYNVDNLTGRPWWTAEQTTYKKYIQMLEDNWKVIRDEGLAQMDVEAGVFIPEEENLREKGDWRQFTLYQQGRKLKKNCEKAPKTCALIEKMPDAKSCTRGQIKFSIMQPGVHVWPHCGPTNCRLRAHLGLVIPEGVKIRVTEDTRTWQEGKVIIFDDSFEHEVWHEGKSFRLVLIIDFWHPEITAQQKRTLSPI